MLFNSLTFLVFFAGILATHRLMPTWGAKKVVLLVGSYLFYAAWNPPYVLILLASTAFDWWLARLIWRSKSPVARRHLLLLSLVGNLGLLGYFKYGGFLLENTQLILESLGVAYQPPGWDIVLPVGISFYTFASLSYTIDVYRNEIRGDASFLDYALFVSFFPHLVAGPIVRARVLLPQMTFPRSVSAEQFGWGIALLIMGLFCKVVLADYVFAPVVDSVYDLPAGRSGLESWAAVLGFSGQIYYDFGGYSLCAIGIALCFGFSFPDNFRHPYAARGFSDFWRRWHISLSTWLRDYLYVPLGGNRNGERATYRNLMLTMLIGGLWHGASWMFVLWGALHGAYLALERRLMRPTTVVGNSAAHSSAVALTLFTFMMVTLTWIPFRAPDMATAVSVVAGLFSFSAAGSQLALGQIMLCYLAVGATLLWHFRLRDDSLEAVMTPLSPMTKVALLAGCLVFTFLCSGGEERAFIYFQF